MDQKYAFLSPEWELAADALSDSNDIEAPNDIEFSLNATITPTPYGDKLISIVVKDSTATVDKAHIEDPDITVKCDYETAYTLFLKGDMSIILNAMLEGKIVVQGDISKILNTASSGGLPSMPYLENLGEKLQEITL